MKQKSNFETKTAHEYDRWYQTPEGRYADNMEKELFSRLVQPRRGQSLLEVGCGTGHNLEYFQELGLRVVGVEPSRAMLEVAATKLGSGVALLQAQAENLPFPDNSFDLVALITVLEFLPDPLPALKEASRTAREKVYLGVLNKASLVGITRRIKAKLRGSIYRGATFYTIKEMENLIRKLEKDLPLEWGSVLHFPLGWHRLLQGLDHFFSFRRSPFGAFLGIRLDIKAESHRGGLGGA